MTTKVSVSADALYRILQALTGPGHYIRELQATRSLHTLGHPNPIDILIEDYNAEVKRLTDVTGSSDQVPESPGG